MSSLPVADILFWNGWCSLALGLPLNILLLHLARRNNSTELKDYKMIIYYFCLLNCCTLALQALTQPILFTVADGRSFVFLNGLATRLPLLWLRHLFFSLYFSCIVLIFASLALQFLDRYLIICRSHSKLLRQVSLSVLQKVFLAMSIFLSLSIIPSFDQRAEDLLGPEQTLAISLMADEQSSLMRLAAEANPQTIQTKLVFLAFGLSLLSCYAIILLCYWRIRHILCHNLGPTVTVSPSVVVINRVANWQILLNMALHALVPLYVLSIYAANALLMLSGQFASSSGWLLQLQCLSFVPINWLPLLNPLVTLFTIRSFRSALLVLLRVRKEPTTLGPQTNANANGNQQQMLRSMNVVAAS